MELRQIRHFLAVCETLNYARAAERLHTAQSTITKSVLKLEESLGVKLFERGRFGAALTPFGEALAIRARAMCAEERMALHDLHALMGGRSGTVCIGAGPALSYRVLPQAIARFNARKPDVGIVVTEGTSHELFARLLDGELDLVVSSPAPDYALDPDLIATPLLVGLDDQDYIVVGTTNPLAAMESVTAAALSAFPWAIARSAEHVLARIRTLFELAELPPPTATVRTDSAPLVKSLLATGGYIGVLGTEFFRPEAKLGLLVALPVPGVDWPRRVLLTRRRRSPVSAPAQAFMDELKKAAVDTEREK